MKKKSAVVPSEPVDSSWTPAQVSSALSFGQLPEALQTKLRGRPKADVTKERITIRLSREVVDVFRATGSGWQTRVDAALKDWLRTHTLR